MRITKKEQDGPCSKNATIKECSLDSKKGKIILGFLLMHGIIETDGKFFKLKLKEAEDERNTDCD